MAIQLMMALHKKLSLYKEFYFSGSGTVTIMLINLTDLGEVEI